MYVMFSMVDWPENLNKTAHDDIPVQSTLPLSDAVDNLWKMVSDNKFTVHLLRQSVSTFTSYLLILGTKIKKF